MATIGGVVTHIFVVELRYAQRLLDREVTPWEDFRQTSIDDVFELGDNARGLLVQFLTSAPDSELDRVLTFQTLTAGTVTASKHKIASNIFLHGIRHWGQIATVLRQKGFADQWPHDMLLSNIRDVEHDAANNWGVHDSLFGFAVPRRFSLHVLPGGAERTNLRPEMDGRVLGKENK